MSFTESDIHKLIDGELAPEIADQVSDWVAADPARVRLAESIDRQNRLLHERFDALLTEPTPEALLETVRKNPPRARGEAANSGSFWHKPMFRAASVALIAGVFAAGGWFGHARFGVAPALPAADTLASLPERAAVAYAVYSPEVRHPVEVPASDEEHLVRWLSNRLAVPVRAPVLGAQGFQLVGGRLLPGDDRPVAQFMYQNAAGKRLTLYVSTLAGTAGAQETAFRFERVHEVNNFYWVEDKRAYALSGNIDREELMPVAQAAYEQLIKPQDAGRATDAPAPQVQPQ